MALKYGTLVTSVSFAACVLLQIFARLVLPSAPSWTEEAARLFFVLAIGCSAGLGFRSGAYVQFDFVFNRFGKAAQRVVELVINVFTVVLFGIFTVAAFRFTWMGVAESSPSLKFPMVIAFSSMLILGSSMFVFAVFRFRQNYLKDVR